MVTNRLAQLEAGAAQAARAEAAQARQDAAQAMVAQHAHDSGGKAPIVATGRRERHHEGLEQVWSWTLDGPEGLAKLPHFHREEAEIAVRSRERHNTTFVTVYHECGELVRATMEEWSHVNVSTLKDDPNTPDDEILDGTNAQIYVALMVPSSNKVFDRIFGARSSARLEAWRL